jgi:hypothetical protein
MLFHRLFIISHLFKLFSTFSFRRRGKRRRRRTTRRRRGEE